MKKHEPFKIPIWEFDQLGIDNDLLTTYCLEFEAENPSVTKSNQGGYQLSLIHISEPTRPY